MLIMLSFQKSLIVEQFQGNYLKVSVKVKLGVLLKFLVFANLESVGCEVYFPEKKILKN